MPENFEIFGRTLIGLGLLLILVGTVILYGDRIPLIGKLPGDIYIQKENVSFYFPIATSLVVSLVISLFLWFLRK